jgi:hypothetical protein
MSAFENLQPGTKVKADVGNARPDFLCEIYDSTVWDGVPAYRVRSKTGVKGIIKVSEITEVVSEIIGDRSERTLVRAQAYVDAHNDPDDPVFGYIPVYTA